MIAGYDSSPSIIGKRTDFELDDFAPSIYFEEATVFDSIRILLSP